MTWEEPTSRVVRSVTRIVVLGTGTGVGKTWITRTLAAALRREGADAIALKPIETGVTETTRSRSDFESLATVSSREPRPPPFVFHEPVSPHLAARRAGTTIDLEWVIDYVETHENAMTSHVMSFLLIESAGGALSPLAPGVTNAELVLALEPAICILVAPDALGVLHDVSATLEALAARGRSPDWVVLSKSRLPDASTGTNAEELHELGIVTPAAVAGHGDAHALDGLARALVEHARARG